MKGGKEHEKTLEGWNVPVIPVPAGRLHRGNGDCRNRRASGFDKFLSGLSDCAGSDGRHGRHYFG